ncbi:MAG: hypothetical protein WCJ64_12180 [Rhodospirillaceae bacterium]
MNANIKNLETMYKETNNPLYVWQAVMMLSEPQHPFPSWVRQYVDDVALNIVRLALEVPPGGTDFLAGEGLDNSEKTAKLPAALGLGGQGKKPFEEFTNNERRASFAVWYERMVESGEKAESIIATAQQHFKISRSNVLRRISIARRLWTAQRRDQS